MAIEAKADFLTNMEQKLSAEITAADMVKVLRICADVLQGYTMDVIALADVADDDMLDCYVSALQVQGRSQKTIDRYVYVINKLRQFAKVPTRQISVYHLRSYLAAEQKRGIADVTLEGYRSIFSAYFNWLQRESLIEKNPAANLGAIKCKRKEKETYSAIEFEKLIRSANNVRDIAIIHFLSATGCRISEMTELDRRAVNLTTLECIVNGKGKKERTVYLDEVAGMVLKEYLNKRRDNNKALFVSARGEHQRIAPAGVRAMLKKLAKKAGVEHVHPHKFRRTLATDLARHGMPIQEVASILGHEKLDTTMKYVVLNKEDIKCSYRRYA